MTSNGVVDGMDGKLVPAGEASCSPKFQSERDADGGMDKNMARS